MLICAGVLVALLLLEIGVRIFAKPVYPILRTDKSVGTIMESDVRKYLWHNESQKEVLVITNSLGYVGPERTATTSALRVALLGDSTTASIEVDYFRSFSYLLEQSINTARSTREKPVEIMNYGIGGTGTFLQYQRYKKHVAPYHPDYVILMFSDNDFTDNLNKVNYDPEHYEESTSRNVFWKDFLLRFQLPKFVFVKLQHNISFLRLLNTLGLYEFNEYTKKALTEGESAVENDPAYYNFTFDLIKRLRDRVEADGGKFVVIQAIIPKMKNMDEWRVVPQYRALEEFLNEERIPLVVLGLKPAHTIVSEFPDTSICINLNCTGHLNERGHQLMARLLYPEFRRILYSTPY